MCLDTVADFKPAQTGYKVLAKGLDGSLHSALCGTLNPQPMNKWLDEKKYREDCGDKLIAERGRFSGNPTRYLTGWHILHTKKAARGFKYVHAPHGRVIAKVQIKEPIAVGYQDGSRVTVAKKIKIIEIYDE